MQDTPRRLQAIKQELDRAVYEYTTAKETFDDAQVRFEAARARFAGVRQLATAALSSPGWWKWNREHPNVKYAALPIGEAILSVLQNQAWQAATSHVEDRTKPFMPWMNLDKIIEELDEGGFDFRTAAPLREVNAALIRLEGTQKDELHNWYTVADLEEVLRMAESVQEALEVVEEE